MVRSTAEKAGLTHVVLLAEQEAALYYALYDEVECTKMVSAGAKIAVVDAGGGTVDFGVYQLRKGGSPDVYSVEEVTKSTGRFGGGEKIDHLFAEYMRNRVGDKAWRQFVKSTDYEERECLIPLAILYWL